VPGLVATGRSQVFTWNITKVAGPVKSMWFHTYVITDIYSRYIVGHTWNEPNPTRGRRN
jgi:transposase InsO family protein